MRDGGMFGWRHAVAQAGLMMAGGLFLLSSGALIAVAAWLWLAEWRDPIIASLIVAAGCAVMGGLLFLLARPRRQRVPPPTSDREAAVRALFLEAGLRVPERGESPPLVEAFLFGLTTALRLGGDRRR